MTNNRFQTAIANSYEAKLTKTNNIESISKIIEEVVDAINYSSSDKVTILKNSSKLEALAKLTIPMMSPIGTFVSTKPLTQILYITSTEYSDIQEEWTSLEMSNIGYPCTIYIDGNRVTSETEEDLIESFESLLSSPITAELIDKVLKRVENIKNNL